MIEDIKKQAREDLNKIVGKKSLNPGIIAFENLLMKYIEESFKEGQYSKRTKKEKIIDVIKYQQGEIAKDFHIVTDNNSGFKNFK